MPRKIIEGSVRPNQSGQSGMREIVRPTGSNEMPTGRSCPACGGSLSWGQVACPDGRPGCLVMHYGYTCSGCGKQFE